LVLGKIWEFEILRILGVHEKKNMGKNGLFTLILGHGGLGPLWFPRFGVGCYRNHYLI
jgi:hypothetical protein